MFSPSSAVSASLRRVRSNVERRWSVVIDVRERADRVRCMEFTNLVPPGVRRSCHVSISARLLLDDYIYLCSALARMLLVRHSNQVLSCTGDIAGFLCSWVTSPLFHPNFGVFPLLQIAHVGVSPSRSLTLFGREIIFEVFQPVWKTYLNVTDRRTDRQTDGRLTVA